MTKKRMIKLIMGMGYPRNVANEVAFYVQVRQLKYEDFREIMDDIQKNADDIVRRDKNIADEWDRFFEITKSLAPTPGNPYPASSLNRPPMDFDLPMQARLARVFIADKRRKIVRANRRLAYTFKQASIAADEAAAAFGNLASAFGTENGYDGLCNIPYEIPPQANPERVKFSFGNKPNPFLPQADVGSSDELDATIRKLMIEANRAFTSRQSALLGSEHYNNIPNLHLFQREVL